MKRSICVATAFSLIEVTLALGIAAFCLIAVFGLMPVGVQTNRNATSQTAATNIMAAVVADLRATPTTKNTSAQFGIVFGTAKTLYFDGTGQFATSLSHKFSVPAERNMEHIDSEPGLFASAMRRCKGSVAGSCLGGKCEWLDRNVCRVRQELNRCVITEIATCCRVRCPLRTAHCTRTDALADSAHYSDANAADLPWPNW